ncbi:MAG: chloride channel protein [Gemmatimonadaceae bacterium]
MPAIRAAALPLRLRKLVEEVRRKEDRLSLLLSLVIGALVGLVVVAFLLVTGRLAALMYPPGGSGWSRVLVPTLGSLATGYLLFKYFPLARGSGIPQTRAALFIHDGRISLRSVAGKLLCCSISLASGIPLGREGPSVYIGSGLASVIARRLGLSRAQVRSLIPVGGAAALSAAFNTPISAVLFSLEEIVGDLHAPALGSVVLASAASWIVLHLVLGDSPLFHVAGYHLVSPAELAAYVVLGITGGLISVAFVKMLLWLRARFTRLPRATLWLQPVAGGLTVGAFGYFVPQVLGVGYDQVERVLNGDVVLKVVVILGVLKIISTSIAYASGNAGGIFGPSLFIGSMIGASVGAVTHQLFPASTAGPGAYALVGMGTAFAGIVRAPLTSVIMIFEVTRDYTIIVPLMIANLIAYYISQRLQKEPIYEALARQDGLHLPTRSSRTPPEVMLVSAATREAPIALDPEMTIGEAAAHVRESNLESWPVSDELGLVGMVRTRHIAHAVDRGREEMTVAKLMQIARRSDTEGSVELPHVHNDQPLSRALARMRDNGHKVLPVVSRANGRIMLGVVTFDDILKAYGVETADQLDYRDHPDL